MQYITDNKTIRPYLSDNGYNQTKITVLEKDCIITNIRKKCNSMNNYFVNIIKKLRFETFNSL